MNTMNSLFVNAVNHVADYLDVPTGGVYIAVLVILAVTVYTLIKRA
jgi:hypothetical protein